MKKEEQINIIEKAKKKAYITFSRGQKERRVLEDDEIRKQLDKIGVNYLLLKNIHYIVNDIDKLDLSGKDEITSNFKKFLNENGKSGIFSI